MGISQLRVRFECFIEVFHCDRANEFPTPVGRILIEYRRADLLCMLHEHRAEKLVGKAGVLLVESLLDGRLTKASDSLQICKCRLATLRLGLKLDLGRLV